MHEKTDVEITTQDNVTIVRFSSSFISAVQDLDDISKKITDFISANYPQKIVVDFHHVKFFSSSILGLLVYVRRKLQDYGGQIVISGINPQLHRVFKITNLDKIFNFYPDKETAAKAIRET